MATEAPRHTAHRPATLDDAVHQLLRQQADIQARLADLLPATYRQNFKLEVDMLRHKLRTLQAYAHHHEQTPVGPVLFEAEEARSLQYRCECIEAAILDQGLNLADPTFIDALKRNLDHLAPAGYASWLDNNLARYDPVFRIWSMRGGNPAPGPVSLVSFKCWDEECLHYIYGFSNREDRNSHANEHTPPTHRDSGLSIGGPASFPFPLDPPAAPAASAFGSLDTNAKASQLPRPHATHALPPIATSVLPRDRSNSLHTRPGSSELPVSARHSVFADVDPLLPPLAASRVGQPRLQSIGELNLVQDAGPCLQCRVLQQPCDPNDPCSHCANQLQRHGNDFSRLSGCHRGPLENILGLLLPAPVSPRQMQTPITSPLAQRRSVNEYLEKSYPVTPAILADVKAHLDYDDGFWSTEELASVPLANPTLAHYPREPMKRPPPILAVLFSSWNTSNTAYNLMRLLEASGQLSATREAEEMAYPVLYRAKLLLREVVFWDLQQQSPSIHLHGGLRLPHQIPEDVDYGGHYRLLCNCLTQFLQAFELVALRKPRADMKTSLAVFMSVCLFSAIRTILTDTSINPTRHQTLQPPTPNQGPLNPGLPQVDGVYQLLVITCRSMQATPFDEPIPEGIEGLGGVFRSLEAVIHRGLWTSQGIWSSSDFLTRLGNSPVDENTEYIGFLKPSSRPQTDRFAVPALIAKPTDEPQTPLTNPGSSGDPWNPSSHNLPDRDSFIPRAGPDQLSSPTSYDNSSRRQTMMESPPLLRGGSARPLESPALNSRTRVSYQRTPLRRVYCSKCNEYPEGFRGEHELRRHADAKHAATVKRWVCIQPDSYASLLPQPIVPLAKCKACVTQKRYGAYYNAAAHLRRAHFNPNRAGKASGDWPPMTILKDWMKEIRQSVYVEEDQQDDSSSDDGEVEGDYTDQLGVQSPVQSIPLLAPAPARGLMPAPPLITELGDSVQQDNSSSRIYENRTKCPHPDCGKVYKDLVAHMLTHQEERPEKCPIETCEYHTKGFARKYDKNRHALTHYKGTMICPFCPGIGSAYEKAFNRADVFKRHLTSVHNVEQTPPNSRKFVASGPGTGTAVGEAARCSICQAQFATAQEFYEHLDDCVLNVIVPAAARSRPRGSSMAESAAVMVDERGFQRSFERGGEVGPAAPSFSLDRMEVAEGREATLMD